MAGKGGGAWKVAYADFVTAMMAFFLVMWICGQDQKVKRAVSYYFNDPLAASKMGSSKKPSRSASVSEFPNSGSVPSTESVAMGRGRNSYTTPEESSATTKMVSDWVMSDKNATRYWREQAQKQRDQARRAKEFGGLHESVDKTAARQLSKQMKEEITRGIPGNASNLYKDMLLDAIAAVNWTEIAEDLLAQ